jgi:hypothetical protein
MTDPIGALNSILKGKRTLPNGGGNYTVANSTPMGVSYPPTNQFDLTNQTPSFQQAPPAAPVSATAPPAPTPDLSQPGQSGYTPGPVTTPTPAPQEQSNSGSVDYMDKYRQLALEQARHSSQGTGLYALQQGVQYTPDQIMAQRKSADDLYNQTLGEYSKAAQDQLTQQSKAPTRMPLSDISSSPWLEGLRVAVGMQGGTKDERAENLEYLASLPEDRQRDLIKSAVYNKMSVGQQQKLDSYGEISSGAQQILNMTPADVETNPYKYVGEKYGVFLGGKGSKGYQEYEAILGRITAPIINNIYGAAVTGAELSRAQTIIPDLAIDSTQRATVKLKNLAAFAEFAEDAALAKAIGTPRPKLDDYIKKYEGIKQGSNNSTGGFAEEW